MNRKELMNAIPNDVSKNQRDKYYMAMMHIIAYNLAKHGRVRLDSQFDIVLRQGYVVRRMFSEVDFIPGLNSMNDEALLDLMKLLGITEARHCTNRWRIHWLMTELSKTMRTNFCINLTGYFTAGSGQGAYTIKAGTKLLRLISEYS